MGWRQAGAILWGGMAPATRADSRFRLVESQARELAEKFGTPLYVIDERTFRDRIRRYREASLKANPKSQICYASKANSTLGLLKIAYEEGCWIDVASEGELRAALLAGVPAEKCVFHGNNKLRSEVAYGLEVGVGIFVIDNFEEIDRLKELKGDAVGPQCVMRLAPGVDPKTHEKIRVGQADTKFGFNITDGSALEAAKRCLASGLNLVGVHCHVGSQLIDPTAQRQGGEAIAEFAARLKTDLGFEISYINVGGGLGVKYVDADDPMTIEEYCPLVLDAVARILEGSGLDPIVAQEPGRALVGEAGVTLYEVGVIKTIEMADGARRTYVSVDGGVSDNPRPALYSAQYTVERVVKRDPAWEYVTDGPGAAFGAPLGDQVVTVSGRHCETDRLFADVSLPKDLAVGDLLQVLSTGAYNSSMASNYNRFPRPAVVLVQLDGAFKTLAARESWDDLFRRETV